MNKKQCQKCGEENPPEAVMCWACYTPLSGAAAAPAGNTPARATKDDSEKKPIPPWQMVVIGLALVVGIGMGVKTLLPSSDPYAEDRTERPTGEGTGRRTPPTRNIEPPVVAPPGDLNRDPLPKPPEITKTTTQPLMRIEVVPNPKLEVATMGIVPTEQNISEYKAASLAALAHRHMVNPKRWRRIQIYVFSDQQAALMFRNYQRKRRGAPLDTEDYQSLTALWQRTPAAYEFYGNYERWVSPSKRPSDWWENWPDFTRRA